MTEFALVGPSGEIKAYSRAVNPDVGTKPGWRWLPVERPEPAFNSDTEKLGDEVVAIDGEKISVTREPRAKTMDELDRERAADAEEKLPLALATVLAEMDNRVRVLEGKAPRTVEDFRAGVIGGKS